MTFIKLDASDASENFKAHLDSNPHLVSYRVVCMAYDKNAKVIRNISNTSTEQLEKYLRENSSENLRDDTNNYWNCFDSSTQTYVRGYVSHFPTHSDIEYIIEFHEDETTATDTKKAFVSLVKKEYRMPPFSPEMMKVFNGEDFDPNKLRAEASKFKDYKELSLKKGGQ